jgi:ribonuclease HI
MFDGSYTINTGISSHGFCAWKFPEKEFLFGVANKNPGSTVNEAEYYALISSLVFIKNLSLKDVYVIGDSQLIISQVRGRSSVLKETLKILHTKVKDLLKDLDVKEFFHVPRKFNSIADLLSRIGRTADEQKVFYEASGDFNCDDNPIYSIYRLFPNYKSFRYSLDYNYLRGTDIVKMRFKEALEEIGKKVPRKIEGYNWI